MTTSASRRNRKAEVTFGGGTHLSDGNNAHIVDRKKTYFWLALGCFAGCLFWRPAHNGFDSIRSMFPNPAQWCTIV